MQKYLTMTILGLALAAFTSTGFAGGCGGCSGTKGESKSECGGKDKSAVESTEEAT